MESNSDIKRQLSDMLSNRYELDFVDTIEEATSRLMKKGVYSAVLLDAFREKDNSDGFDFLNEIKRDVYAHPPVMAIMEEYDSRMSRRVIAAGAEEFVLCPLDEIVLCNRLKNVIARSNIFNIDSTRYILKYDTLTGLFNRHTMFMETNKMLHNNSDNRFCIAIIDLKRFSLYNSTFGEHEGDLLLCKVADLIKYSLRNTSICTYGRIAADVFALCLPYDKEAITEQLLMIKKNIKNIRNDYIVEASTGIYVVYKLNDTIESMFYKARKAANKQKTEFIEDVVIYDCVMEEMASNEQLVNNEMKRALEDGQFAVYLQPKVSLNTGKIYGAEALARWIHPTRGILQPSTFIPIFEKNGFISKLDFYMWESVCKIIKRWIENGIEPTPISVNMSRISLYNPNVSDMFEALIQKYDIPSKYIGIEITESAYMDHPELMKNTLHRLKQLGFIVMMDDFGSGYSSLNTLKEFDIDVVKIDMKFLPQTDNKEKGQIILSAMVEMVDSLKIESVIEGVETEEQKKYLKDIGCNMAQGYYFSRPVPVAEYEKKILYKCS